jgi:hypothetical protein
MYTPIETPILTADAKTLWTEEERGAFCAWRVQNPEAGEVIPGSGGYRIGPQGGLGAFRQGLIYPQLAHTVTRYTSDNIETGALI